MVQIDDKLVRRLVANQFPQWAQLPIRPVARSGWDNRTFHLGEEMLVRLPSAEVYSLQVEKEQRWLPKLAPMLPLAIPVPLAMGQPGEGYPWQWSVYRWLKGDSAATASIANLNSFARSLAQFLLALHRVETKDGPLPGLHSFQRGGNLSHYDGEVRQALALLSGKIDTQAAEELWEAALATSWDKPPVWVHGDISAGNLLVRDSALSAVIDFGQLAVGDPACDLAIAWTLFQGESRDGFRKTLNLDAGTWTRGRAWTLWKALIIAAGIVGSNAVEGERCWRIIDEVLDPF